jgi:hypothetical protein
LAGLTAFVAASAPGFPREPDSQDQPTNPPVCYSLADGRIEIKSRLKYELFLSLHVLRTAEDHHQLFIPWAQRMRASLAPETLQQATNLNAVVHEWQLCALVQDYDGPDTLAGLTNYLHGARQAIARQPSQYVEICRQALGISPEQAADWLAQFLSRYYAQGFGAEWPAQRRLLEQQAARDVQAFQQLPYSITAFLEKHTGRKFQGSVKLIFYPSSFSRPQHAYGFSEKGDPVVVYKVGSSPVDTALHELLHPLLQGWHRPERVQQAVAALGRDPLFQADVGLLRGSYDYPRGCVEELLVHSVANYLSVKAGLLSEASARRHSYGAYENALYDALFDRYDSFPVIDEFIDYALQHIRKVDSGGRAAFAYVKAGALNGQP